MQPSWSDHSLDCGFCIHLGHLTSGGEREKKCWAGTKVAAIISQLSSGPSLQPYCRTVDALGISWTLGALVLGSGVWIAAEVVSLGVIGVQAGWHSHWLERCEHAPTPAELQGSSPRCWANRGGSAEWAAAESSPWYWKKCTSTGNGGETVHKNSKDHLFSYLFVFPTGGWDKTRPAICWGLLDGCPS